jgi:uncharacterized membrane protein YcgQ (UPF0703/DUF1980 family)
MLGLSACPEKQGFALSGRTNKNGTAGLILPGGESLGAVGSGGLLAPESTTVLSGDIQAHKRVLTLDAQYAGDQEVVEIKEKMFIAQTNDVYLNPEDYLGKTIKLEGIFQTQSYGAESPYYFVIRYGPGCCGNDGNAGFEVMWEDTDAVYPQENDWVQVVGVLGAYEEDGYPYICIGLSSLEVLETRGQEFVTQ